MIFGPLLTPLIIEAGGIDVDPVATSRLSMPRRCCRISVRTTLFVSGHPGVARDDTRSVADGLTEQVEAADIIVLDNSADIDRDEIWGMVALLTAPGPEAIIIESEHNRIAPDIIFQRAASRGSAHRPVPGLAAGGPRP